MPKIIKNRIISNLIAVIWNDQKSKTARNSSWKKTKFWLLYQHIDKKARKKCHTLARVCNHINLNKRRSEITTFAIFKFSSSLISYFVWFCLFCLLFCLFCWCFIAGCFIACVSIWRMFLSKAKYNWFFEKIISLKKLSFDAFIFLC